MAKTDVRGTRTKRNVTPTTTTIATTTTTTMTPRTPEPRRREEETTTPTVATDADDEARTPSPMTHRCENDASDADAPNSAEGASSSSSPEEETEDETETHWRDFARKLNVKDGEEEPAMPVGGKSNVGSRPTFGAKRFHSPTDAALSPASKFVARKAHHVNHAPVVNLDDRSAVVGKPSRFATVDKENVGAVPIKSRFAR